MGRDLQPLESEQKISFPYIEMQFAEFMDLQLDGTDTLPPEVVQTLNKNFKAEMVK
jgi:hypothetical protein